MTIIFPDKVYVSQAEMGYCKVCGNWKDLRCGSCEPCCKNVAGKPLKDGGHKLWDNRNPKNYWFIRPN